MREPRFRIGDRVQFQYGPYSKQGIVKEDRGPIGIKGRRLYAVEFHMGPQAEYVYRIELPAVDLQLVDEKAPTK